MNLVVNIKILKRVLSLKFITNLTYQNNDKSNISTSTYYNK